MARPHRVTLTDAEGTVLTTAWGPFSVDPRIWTGWAKDWPGATLMIITDADGHELERISLR